MLTRLPRRVPAALGSALARLASAFRPRAARRTGARRAVAFGALVFALFTLGLETAAETVKPEWRDPEYGHRLRQVRRWQQKKPDRPLVLVFGSSRAQMAVAPAAMDFPDRPGSPLVYNFGYRGAHPVFVELQAARLFDDGVKPAAVVVMISVVESKINGPAEEQFPLWGARLSAADRRRLEPYTRDPTAFRKGLEEARRAPWESRRGLVVSDVLPDWQTYAARAANEGWERMDRYGWTPFPAERMNDDLRKVLWAETEKHHTSAINVAPPSAVSDRALHAVLSRCREAGIPAALVWAPEAPAYRALYAPSGRAYAETYGRSRTAEFGVPVFSAPEHIPDSDFVDGFHLLPEGAEKYSRWLADTHLKPWLAGALK